MKPYAKPGAAITLSILLVSILFMGNKINNIPDKIIQRGNIFYLSHTIIIKTKANGFGAVSKSLNVVSEFNKIFSKYNFTTAEQIFGNSQNSDPVGLSRIMSVHYESNDDPNIVAAKLRSLDNIEFAEPWYVRRIFKVAYQPNDPDTGLQYYLKKDNMFNAWDIAKGDSSIIIGIVDTGVDWLHPDLNAHIWHNWKDINSNWAGDQDGIMYDSIGWDFGGDGAANYNPTPDPNPIEDIPVHGTLVAGVASAVTDNSKGIAGMGFNSYIMPVKAAQKNLTDPTTGSPLIEYGFEGIKYAVDNGAKVINCSWGGGGYSQTEQDVIDYAVSKGTLVVVAAGNDNTNMNEYPAAYNGVLAVAATDTSGLIKSSYSNYGAYVDVCAPGDNIFGTFQPSSNPGSNEAYTSGYGTSFAAPQAAGLAALVFSKFPSYNPLQVAEQIRVNCDNIDLYNPGYEYQLGSGKIDGFKALSNTDSKSVRALEISATDSVGGGNGNGIFEPGETIAVKMKFRNYLNPVSGLIVSLQSLSPYATVTVDNFSTGVMGMMDSTDNYSSPYKIVLSPNIPVDYTLSLKLNYTDDNYTDFQVFNFPVNPSYLTQTGNNVSLTITSKGNFGFNDYPVNIQGNGFKFKSGDNLLFEGALMFGTSADKIEDAARGANQDYADRSFNIVQPFYFRKITPDVQEGYTIFDDDSAGGNKIGIRTILNTYTYSNQPDNNYIILNYSFINKADTSVSDFYAGIFCDWDLIGGAGDNASYDSQNNFGYAYHSGFNTWVGSALISGSNYGFWAITNDGSDGGFSIYDGFSPSEKWQALSSQLGKLQAGPGDISEVTSAGPFGIPPGDTIHVAFAIAAGGSLNDIANSVQAARNKYPNIVTGTEKIPATISYGLTQNYPNPFNPSTVINYQLEKASFVSLKIYDILGREVRTLVNGEKPAGKHRVIFDGALLPSGVYFYKIDAGNYSSVKKMILLR